MYVLFAAAQAIQAAGRHAEAIRRLEARLAGPVPIPRNSQMSESRQI